MTFLVTVVYVCKLDSVYDIHSVMFKEFYSPSSHDFNYRFDTVYTCSGVPLNYVVV